MAGKLQKKDFAPKRNPKLRLAQKDGMTVGTIDGKSHIAIPDVLLAALALSDGTNTVSEIAYHLVKNTKMTEDEMATGLLSAFELMEKNRFVTFAKPPCKGKRRGGRK